MIDLDRRVFGSVTAKEIIGADPPAPEMRARLEGELSSLVSGLGSVTDDGLRGLLERQDDSAGRINSRPGAMALAHEKIRLFNEYNGRYVGAIRRRLRP